MKNNNLVTVVSDGFCKVEKTVTWIAFAGMLSLLLIQVFCRYIFSMPLAWAEELVRYTYIAVSFTGAVVAVRERSHIGIDIILSLVNKAFQSDAGRRAAVNALNIFSSLVQVIFFAFITKWMIEYNFDIAAKGQITTCNEWPMWAMCLPVTVSCVLMVFHGILNTMEGLTDIFSAGKGGAAAR